MANNNGQQAKNWKQLNLNSTKSTYDVVVKNIKDLKQREVLNAIYKILTAHIKDIYGNAKEEKYINIVDLIIERITTVINDTKLTLIDEQFEDFKKAVLDIINLAIQNNQPESIALTDSDVQNIISSILSINNENIYKKVKEAKQIITELSNVLEIEEKSNNKENSQPKKEQNDTEDIEKPAEKEQVSKENESENINIDNNISIFNEKLLQLKINIENIVSFNPIITIGLAISSVQNGIQQIIENDIIKIQNKNININTDQNITKRVNNILDQINSLIPNKKQQKINKQFLLINTTINNAVKTIMGIISNTAYFIIDNVEFVLNVMIKGLSKTILNVFKYIVLPVCILIGTPITLAIPPLARIIMPIINVICSVIKNIIDIVKTILVSIFKPIIHFILDVIGPPLKEVLTTAAEGIATIVREVSPRIAEIYVSFIEFLKKFVQFYIAFLTPIKDNAKLIGERIITIILLTVSVLSEFFSGMSDDLVFNLGQGLATFAISIIDVLIQLFKGFGANARRIGQEMCLFFITGVQILTKFIEGLLFANAPQKFAEIIVTFVSGFVLILPILIAFVKVVMLYWLSIIDAIVMFFKGIGVLAYEVGEAFSEFMLNIAELRLVYIREFKAQAHKIGKIFADELIPNTDKIEKGLKYLVIKCGGIPTDISDNLTKFREFLEKILNLETTINKLASGELSFERIKEHVIWINEVWDNDAVDLIEDYSYKIENALSDRSDVDTTKTIILLNKLYNFIDKLFFVKITSYNILITAYKLIQQFFGISYDDINYYIKDFNNLSTKNQNLKTFNYQKINRINIDKSKNKILFDYIKNTEKAYAEPSNTILDELNFSEQEKNDVNKLLDNIEEKLLKYNENKNLIYKDIIDNNNRLYNVMINPEYKVVQI